MLSGVDPPSIDTPLMKMIAIKPKEKGVKRKSHSKESQRSQSEVALKESSEKVIETINAFLKIENNK